LKEVNEKPKVNLIVEDIYQSVHGGSSFTEALAKHPKVFSKLYISMVRAGEASGILDKILDRLASFLEKSQQLKDSILNALIYPILLVIIGGSAVAILLTFVIPKFVTIFEDMGTEIPLPTQILLGMSDFIVSWWWALLMGGIALFFFLRYLLTIPSIRFSWDSFKFRSPIFGNLIQKIEVARFTRTFGTLIQSGVPILQALTIVKDTVTNAKIADSIDPVYIKVKDGSGVADPLEEQKTFPVMAIQMIKVGEETGQLESMLLKVAETYELEVEKTVKALISLLEPLMILVMGGIVGAIVISMLMAIFSINDISF
ncbi:MAG: type II secretion system F family protein, partial [Nitrospinae bacterium]|nr:type II secretion system F family protein [Nitrospinota bacterium]